ncbi:MAG: efflux RND transporter periplasmic adaptor subunit [Gallionella sp.]
MSKQKIGLTVLGISVLALFAWVVMTQGPLVTIRVTVEKATVGKLNNEVFGVGVVEAKHSYSLSPIMTGRVRKVLVEQGDVVNAGQLLVEMDAVDLDDRVISSQQAAKRTVYGVIVAEAQLSETRSRAKTSVTTYERYFELRSRGFVSQEMLDAKLNEMNAAVAAQDAATASLESARLEQVRAHAEASGINKLRAQIRLLSPVDGIVTDRLIEPGATVVAGQAVIQVVDPDSLWIKTRIDQKQAGPVRVGQTAQILLRSQPNSLLSGIVRRVDLIGDAITEERIVNVAFATQQSAAAVGDLAEVTIKLPDMDRVLSVPTAAVKHVDRDDGVWITNSGHIEFKQVVTGIATLEGRTQIVSGLVEGDEVIVFSQQQLRTNSKVKVVPEIVRGNP